VIGVCGQRRMIRAETDGNCAIGIRWQSEASLLEANLLARVVADFPRFEGTDFDALDRRVEFDLRVPVKMSTGEMNIDSSTDRIRDRSSTSDGRFAIHPKCDRPERQRAANPESSSHQA
jgi:hypothetical protein